MSCRLKVQFEGASVIPRSCPRCGISGKCQLGYSQLAHNQGGYTIVSPEGVSKHVKPWDNAQLPEGTGEGPKTDVRPASAEQALKDFFRVSDACTYKVTIASAEEHRGDFIQNNLNTEQVITLFQGYLAVKNKRRAHVFSVTPELPD